MGGCHGAVSISLNLRMYGEYLVGELDSYWDIFFEIGEVKGGSESILGEV